MSEPANWQMGLPYQEREGRVNPRGYLEELAKVSLLGIVFIRFDGTVEELNEAAANYLSVERSACIAQSFWSIFPDDLFGFSLKESLCFALKQKLIYAQVGARVLEISSSFYFEGPKSGHGLLVLLTDVTEIHLLKAQLQQQERMQELGEMSARVSHEIRNALGPIRGYASLLLRDLQQEPHLQEMVSRILEGAKSLEGLLSRILHYSRPIKIEIQSIEMGLFLKKLMSSIKADPALSSAVDFEVHIPQKPLLAPIDSNAMQRCLLNLIYNGIQAMPGGGALLISLLRPMEHMCQIDISDTGEGIEEEHVEHLFSPFFTTKNLGTGLGLAESQKIVKAHGGAISVRSQKGRGSTFTITLPLKR